MAVVEFKKVSRVYRNGDHEQWALNHVDLSLEEGRFIVILGPSGAGKSTMLNLLGGLDSPTEGTILVDGKDISTLSDNELADYRAATVGFVFQSYNLIPTLTVQENVALVKEIAPDPLSSHAMIDAVGLTDHVHNFPSELSGGEQQRVAIARALINDPDVIFADEPTGNLDSAASGDVMEVFKRLNRTGKTILIVTHDPEVAGFCGRVVTIRDGAVGRDEKQADSL